ALLGTSPTEVADKAMLHKSRIEANAIVDGMQKEAAALHGGKYAPESIKLDKLRGVLTLAIFQAAKEPTTGGRKNSLEFMPKSGFGDLVRSSLSARDQDVLACSLSGNGFKQFESQMLESANQVQTWGHTMLSKNQQRGDDGEALMKELEPKLDAS